MEDVHEWMYLYMFKKIYLYLTSVIFYFDDACTNMYKEEVAKKASKKKRIHAAGLAIIEQHVLE